MKKIVQIIEAPKNMYSKFIDEDEEVITKTVLLALVEDEFGTYVDTISQEDYSLDLDSDASNFRGYVYDKR
ncbi:hypothetical protein NRP93_000445 [Clostridium botulinum]|nr:hypothetical protein [Clostridium botulinum]